MATNEPLSMCGQPVPAMIVNELLDGLATTQSGLAVRPDVEATLRDARGAADGGFAALRRLDALVMPPGRLPNASRTIVTGCFNEAYVHLTYLRRYWVTPRGTPLALLGDMDLMAFLRSDLALPLPDDAPAHTECVVCQGPFAPEVTSYIGCDCTGPQTLCSPCYDGVVDHARANDHRPLCPLCRADFRVLAPWDQDAEADTWRKLAPALNEARLAVQAAIRRYRCLHYPECTASLLATEVRGHLEACSYRRVLCDSGCARVLPLGEAHRHAADGGACGGAAAGVIALGKALKHASEVKARLEASAARIEELRTEMDTELNDAERRVREQGHIASEFAARVRDLMARNGDLRARIEEMEMEAAAARTDNADGGGAAAAAEEGGTDNDDEAIILDSDTEATDSHGRRKRVRRRALRMYEDDFIVG